MERHDGSECSSLMMVSVLILVTVLSSPQEAGTTFHAQGGWCSLSSARWCAASSPFSGLCSKCCLLLLSWARCPSCSTAPSLPNLPSPTCHPLAAHPPLLHPHLAQGDPPVPALPLLSSDLPLAPRLQTLPLPDLFAFQPRPPRRRKPDERATNTQTHTTVV